MIIVSNRNYIMMRPGFASASRPRTSVGRAVHTAKTSLSVAYDTITQIYDADNRRIDEELREFVLSMKHSRSCGVFPANAHTPTRIRYRNANLKPSMSSEPLVDETMAALRAKAVPSRPQTGPSKRFFREAMVERDTSLFGVKFKSFLMLGRRSIVSYWGNRRSECGSATERRQKTSRASTAATAAGFGGETGRAIRQEQKSVRPMLRVTGKALGEVTCDARRQRNVKLGRKFAELKGLIAENERLHRQGRQEAAAQAEKVRMTVFAQNYRSERSRMTQRMLENVESTDARTVSKIYAYKMEAEMLHQEEAQTVISSYRKMMRNPRRVAARIERQRLRKRVSRDELVCRDLRHRYKDVASGMA